MPANEHVQAAASQLQNAATALKTDIDQIRGEHMQRQRQIQKEIDGKVQDVQVQTVRLSGNNLGDNEEATLRVYVAKLNKDIENLKNDLKDSQTQMAQIIRDKEGAMVDLKGKAQGLQSQASSLK